MPFDVLYSLYTLHTIRLADIVLFEQGIVDYLVYASSLKISKVPELIGTFEDTAAVTMAIAIEEFAKKLIETLF